MSIVALMQDLVVAVREAAPPLFDLGQVFTILFVVMGPPLKTPAVFYMRTLALDAPTRRALAWKTFVLATVAVLLGGFVGVALQHRWQVSSQAVLIAGGLIFLLVSLRTVLEQYVGPDNQPAVPAGGAPPKSPIPSAFELAVPAIVTPYGLAGLILLLAASHSTGRTVGVVAMLVIVMVLHLLAMLFAGPIMRGIGPLPFKLFGTIVGALTVALSIQMLILGLSGL